VFDALFLAERGDVLVAQGKKDEARSAYKAALGKAGAGNASLRGSIQLRLDALGTAK
jgi:predicted negative regulator of RcsB-dependent stress response